MAKRMKFSKDRVVSAIKRTRGNITEAAELLGCGVNTVRRYVTIYQIDVATIGVSLDLDAIRSAFDATYGNVDMTAKMTGMSRPTIYKYMREYPDLAEWRDECEARMVERAKQGLIKHLTEDNWQAIAFVLRTKGGYRVMNDTRVSGDKDEPVVIKVVRDG